MNFCAFYARTSVRETQNTCFCLRRQSFPGKKASGYSYFAENALFAGWDIFACKKSNGGDRSLLLIIIIYGLGVCCGLDER